MIRSSPMETPPSHPPGPGTAVRVMEWGQRLVRRAAQAMRDGQGLVEYGLVLGLMAVVAIGALSATGNNLNQALQRVANSISSVT